MTAVKDTDIWASSGTITEPSDSVKAAGFSCGTADPDQFNWWLNRLFTVLQEEQLDMSGYEPDLLEQYAPNSIVNLDGKLYRRNNSGGVATTPGTGLNWESYWDTELDPFSAVPKLLLQGTQSVSFTPGNAKSFFSLDTLSIVDNTGGFVLTGTGNAFIRPPKKGWYYAAARVGLEAPSGTVLGSIGVDCPPAAVPGNQLSSVAYDSADGTGATYLTVSGMIYYNRDDAFPNLKIAYGPAIILAGTPATVTYTLTDVVIMDIGVK